MVCLAAHVEYLGTVDPFFVGSVFFLEGEVAAEHGALVTDNPYELGSDEAACWVDGWFNAKRRLTA